jgi:uncharacterized membrane protein YhaH (DUF805 family)
MKWWLNSLRHYFDFKGRASRAEYWMFKLLTIIIFVLLVLFCSIFPGSVFSIVFPTLFIVLYLFVFIPSLSVLVRRLHDSDKSGWLVLLSIVPLIGPLIIFIFTLSDSDPLANKYGDNQNNV